MSIKDEDNNYSSLRCIGDWWLPGQGKKISGVFTYDSNNGIRLELHDSFFDEKTTMKGSYQQPEFILGETRSGQEVTLYKAIISNVTYSFSGKPTMVVAANYVFFGSQIQSKKDLRFQKMSLHWQGIESWFAENLFSSTFPSKQDPTARVSFSKPIEFTVSMGKSVSIKSNTDLMTSRYIGQTESGLSYRRSLEIVSSSGRTFDWFMDRMSDLSLFLEVCTAMKLPVTRVRLFKNGSEIFLFFKPGRSLHDKKIDFHNMPLPLSRLRENLQEYFDKWFALIRAAREPIYLLSHGAKPAKGEPFSHFHFLAIVQFLESFHRNIVGPKNIDLYARFLSLMKCLPSYSRKWVAPRTKSFCRQVVRNRNYYTHYSKKQKGVLEAVQLYWLSRRLHLLGLLTIYYQLGLSKKDAHKAIERNPDLVFIRKRKKK